MAILFQTSDLYKPDKNQMNSKKNWKKLTQDPIYKRYTLLE